LILLIANLRTLGPIIRVLKQIDVLLGLILAEHGLEERADKATDPISRQHYREMAIHYRSLSVEHQEVAHQSE
jgi:hypothetical protein